MAIALGLLAAVTSAASDQCTLVQTSFGTVTSKHQNKINPLESEKHAFDGDIQTKWLDYKGANGEAWIQYTHPTAVTVSQYALVSANDDDSRDPSSWILQGSNDEVYFYELDRQTPDQPLFTERHQRRAFEIASPMPYLHYRLLFLSVLDSKVAAGHLQLAEIELRTGSCTDKCCGVICASTGVCVDGKCACQDGYSGVDCGTLDPVWSGPFTNRGLIGSTLESKNNTSVDDCKKLCTSKHINSCAGITVTTSMECKIYSDKAMAAGTGNTYLLVSANLEEENTVFISPRETKLHHVKWDRKGADKGTQMQSITVFRGETVQFEWVDRNSFYGYLDGRGSNDPAPTGRGPNGEDAPNHHSVVKFPSEGDFIRCDFRAANIHNLVKYDLVGNFPYVSWTPQKEGKYYFGSNFEDDCKDNLKIIVTVARRAP